MKRTRRKYLIRLATLITAALATLSVLFGYVRNRETSAARANSGRASDSHGSAISPSKPDRANRIRVSEAYGKLPLSFEANRGQTDSQVKFISRGKGYGLFLTSTGAIFSLQREKTTNDSLGATRSSFEDHRPSPETAAVVRMRFAGANPKAKVTGSEELPGKVNYFIGNDPKKWRTNISTYAKVEYRGIYPGVDLVYHGAQRQLEYDLIVTPGADYRKIKLDFAGVDKLEINANGDLILRAGGEEILQRKPVIYQEAHGTRRKVSGGYALRGKRQVVFRVGHYDRNLPLVIDPVLSYSTYLGGTGFDSGEGIAADAAGNAYVVGTAFTGFPVTPGAFKNSPPGVFVAKLNASGASLLYSTFLGVGSGFGIAVDSTGVAYVTGLTSSSDFPTTPGAFQSALRGDRDAFVTKLNATGSALLYSTYLGGAGADYGSGIAVDSAGAASVSGATNSRNFPTMNAAQSANGGSSLFKSGDGAGSWGISGAGLNASQVQALAIHPAVPSTVYAGTSDGGVFKSVDGGASWSATNAGLSALIINALAIDPITPSTIYAATGSAFSFIPPAGGVFKSTDGGASWNLTGLTISQIYALAIDPVTTSTIYAATNSGVFKSVDGGASWASMNTGLTSNLVRAFAINPANPSVLYAATRALGVSGGGVHKSVDGGNTWTPINNGLTTLDIQSLVIDPVTPSILYAGAAGTVFPNPPAGIFKTTDGGAHWSAINTGLGAGMILTLAVDPITPSTIYASVNNGILLLNTLSTTGGIFKSVNGGASWSATSLTNIFAPALAINPITPSTIYAGAQINSDAFVTQLNPAGTALTYSTYLGGGEPDYSFGIAVDPTGKIHATGGTFSADFPTANALDSTLGGQRDAFVVKLDPSQSGAASLIYSTYLGGSGAEAIAGDIAADATGASYVTGDTGSTDFPVTPGAFRTMMEGVGLGPDAFVAKLNPTGSALVYATYLGGNATDIGGDIAVDASGDAYITGFTVSADFPLLNPLQSAFGSGPVYKSVNGGNSWNPSSTGLPNNGVTGLAIDPSTPTTIYAATDYTSPGGGVFKSVNGGGAWSHLLDIHATAVAIDPTNTAILYAGTTGGVFKSVDAGSSWAATSLSFSTTGFINSIIIDPVNTGTVYVGANGGVFKSNDGGGSWTATSLISPTRSLAIDHITTATIYAGISPGIFKRVDGGVSWSAINTGLTLPLPSISAIVIHPSNPSILYAAQEGASNVGVIKSVDGGLTWSPSGAGLPSLIRSLAIARSSPSILYAGGSGIVFSSANGGSSWNPTGLKTGSVSSLAVAPNAASTVYAGISGGADAFVTRINASGSALVYSTYLGGAAGESGSFSFGGIAVEGANAYVAGVTGSTNFPTTPGAFQTVSDGPNDAFVVKISEDNTPAGSNVTVQPVDSTTETTPATLTFSNVIQSGNTSLTTSATAPPPPPNFQLGVPPTYYDLRTTAVYSGGIRLCINYTGVSFPDESGLRLFHFEGGGWVDVTTSLDIGANDICGNVTSLSPFAIFQRLNPPEMTIYLRGIGPSANPPTLFLETTAPTVTTAKYKDSPAINFNGGNLWKEVGVWRAAPSLTVGSLTALSDLHVWLGLKNSDDQGTNFDLRVEVSKNGALVATGESYCIRGLTRNQNLAKEAIVSFAPFAPVTLNGATDELSLKVLTRIGSDRAGGFCGGHSNAVGLRLYFDSVSRSSRLNAVIAP